MNIYVQQSIHINILRVGSLSNSSILQIGTSGIIKSTAHLANSGGFTELAPMPTTHQGFVISSFNTIPDLSNQRKNNN
ncbi:spore germination protein GerPB [Caldibacillus thermolactis]|jgi:spore germination protein PB|uniref:Spore germination protein GerPB n=1 Tax=Pallidibacillus thermolactis TaxID=251051 RepID=A0ABT2WIZ7_9BACI|nr:spore germination protein GerPB [Pallidibacillus thermolactis]MCU9594961.1 spore germination protein GerPB [Pallidibacillus thermolactis]MCU9601839.1 spore germination protein GerPB [Pallidibacillus thermolactis subsp. kokeshiiformis]MED1674049.1 spore germination protein GerPB [Pallidibacillus thermolactis subsp. kokeshiiformis]